MVGVGVRAAIPLALMEPQFGCVYDKVLGLVVPLLRGQGANLRHLGVNPTNKYIRS